MIDFYISNLNFKISLLVSVIMTLLLWHFQVKINEQREMLPWQLSEVKQV